MSDNKSNKIPKNQHWVPQFYLRLFATADTINTKNPKVWVWDKSKKSSFEAPLSVKKICGKRYLYSPEDINGERNSDIESMFSQMEDKAARLWPYLLAGNVDLTDQVFREFISKFISALHLRNVFVYRTVDNIFELRDKLYGKPSQEFLKSRSEADPDPTHSGRFYIDTIIRNISNISKIISQKRWMVLRSDDAECFTSDRPVVFSHKNISSSKCNLHFPLSPKHVLIASDIGDQPKNYIAQCPNNIVSLANLLVEGQSLRFTISAKPRNKYQAGKRYDKV
jgi:hypothetical protein